MFNELRRIWFAQRINRLAEVYDHVLGTLALSEDGDSWETKVPIGGKEIEFIIGGDVRPDAALMDRARVIVRNFAAFEKNVNDFLEGDDSSLRFLPNRNEGLTIQTIIFARPDRPDEGMICFSGLEDIGAWRCELVAGQPKNLTFDR
ncbi:MAG: hypothetical protein WEB58_17525 [Planctomycetaceae bacterium]